MVGWRLCSNSFDFLNASQPSDGDLELCRAMRDGEQDFIHVDGLSGQLPRWYFDCTLSIPELSRVRYG